jgi:YD repeat-containing protein
LERDHSGKLPFSRSYNGVFSGNKNVVGAHWTTNFQSSVVVSKDGLAVDVLRPDGKKILFALGGDGATWTKTADIDDFLVKLDSSDIGGKWLYRDVANEEVEIYDESGRLIRAYDRRGQFKSFVYSDGTAAGDALVVDLFGNPTDTILPVGMLLKVSDIFGVSYDFKYDKNKRLSRVVPSDGGELVFLYDGSTSSVRSGYFAAGNLTSVIYPDGSSRTYYYNEEDKTSGANLPNALTTIVDENGTAFFVDQYSSDSKVLSQSLGGVSTYGFSYTTTKTTMTDPKGTVRTFNLSTVNGVVRNAGSSQPAGSGCGASASAQTFDANGNVATRTDFNGHVTSYTYDLSRNLETQRVEAKGTTAQRTITTQWHDYWRLPVKVAEPKKVVTRVYNGDNGTYCAPLSATLPSIQGGTRPIGVLCSVSEQATTDENGSQGLSAAASGAARTWKWTYNQHGQVLTVDGPRTDVADVTTYTYYDATDSDLGKRGGIASITDALGHITQITAYDLNGNPLTIVDPNGVSTELSYDLRQRLTSRKTGSEQSSYQYDAVGQLVKSTLPDGSYLQFVYDDAHRLTEVSDALGNRVVYTLDAMGNRIKEESFDPAGQLSTTRQRVFDALNRLAQDIGAQGQVTAYEYDANGNQTKITSPLNQVTQASYDALDRLIAVVDPGQGSTQYDWDGRDQLVQVTDPRGLITRYGKDGLGNTLQQSSPDTGVTQRSVDVAGNVISETDAKGQTSTSQYDALNRPVKTSYADGRQTVYAWDSGSNGIGRLARIDDIASGKTQGSLSYSYDAWGRVVQEVRKIGSISHSIGYGYTNGQLTEIRYPSGRIVRYDRNGAGQISQINLVDGGISQILAKDIAYQPAGGVSSYVDGAGQSHTRSYDQDGRVSGFNLGGNNWLLDYDAAGRIVGQRQEAVATTRDQPADKSTGSAQYVYDDLDRLKTVLLQSTSYSYQYDANGNRLRQATRGQSKDYSVDTASNRLLTVGGVAYQYDANGSVTRDASNQYRYDARGRLIQAVSAAGTTNYQINGLGERIAKQTGSTTTLFDYDRWGHVIAESNGTGVVSREYVWLGDMPVAILQ